MAHIHTEAKRSRAKSPCTRRHFLNIRMPLAYTEWANEGAPIAILVHGNRDHSRSWDGIASVLHRNHHVVAPDLRGHGDSGWSSDGRYNYAAYLSDIDVLFRHLGVTSEQPALLVGHSLGAHVALRFAGARPDLVRHLVAIEAVGAPPALDARQSAMTLDASLRSWFDDRHDAAASRPRLFPSVHAAAERMLSRHPYLTAAQALHLTRCGVRRRHGQWRWKYDPLVTVWPFPELDLAETESLWRHVTCPTLLIYGEKSWPSSVPERLVRTLSDVREIRLRDSGHWPQHDALPECLSAICAFLHDRSG
ncbi:pimeloyl-ACP methyl ester carboxylesterase [Sphingobium sp. OAS761]|uniref:alpha/beta fold hydrolase n=1 Tax=Sphingobium sp. OAS761 TaxID=2817901 RepID=UPI0020A02444|nr:alpha/beta hydrolase [Sphingobium sp. OAS761]MCP1470314.1 pimeloyl-ACP methyl ester carboxylesterase [Sphingobium sp. OAS761]